jgi:three-Cys-motif partner protein
MNNRGHRFGGTWTEQKLECVRKYLQAYTKIMRKQPFRFAYIDAFAGTGYRETEDDESPDELMFPDLVSSEVVSFHDGSARNALEVKPTFMKYVFIEQNINRYAELEELKKEFLLKTEFSEDMIECVHGDANEYLKDLCRRNWKTHRALVFLDPYGMQVEWKTIESIADTQAIDLWILFPLGTVNRLLKKNGEIQPVLRARLDWFFGEPDWYEVFYQVAKQISLFDEEQWQKTGNIFMTIEQYFIERLRGIFNGVAPNPLLLRNSKNVPLYLLCFAAGNQRGAETAVKIAQEILEKMQNPSQLTFQG